MKTDSQIKATNGVLFVHNIINKYWESDWQKVDQENDDAIDGIIHIRENREFTGEVIYAQVKSGNGYIKKTKNRLDYISIHVGIEYIKLHRPRWAVLPGAVILIFVDDNQKAYWVDLKSEKSFSSINRSLILMPKNQRFGAHSKEHFKKIGNFSSQDRGLKTTITEKNEACIRKNTVYTIKKDPSKLKTKIEWNLLSDNIANYMNQHFHNVHRGAILFDHGVTAIFGNDGYEAEQDERAKNECFRFTLTLILNDIKRLGFGLSKDKYSWCILAKTGKVEILNDIIWKFYPQGGSNNFYQKALASNALRSYWKNPLVQYLPYY